MKLTSALAALSSLALSTAFQATTTRYYDGQEGACGCGSNGSMFSWQAGISSGVYTAAASQGIFDSSNLSWCGAGCGLCFQLTSTGSAPCSSCGTGGAAGTSIIVMVTNLCPNNGNAQWCPTVGGTNQYGYSNHFDIMVNGNSFIWDNAVVNATQVSCPSNALSDFSQCVCKAGAGATTAPAPTSSKPVTTSSPPASSSSPPTSGTQAKYGQCGGQGWTGPTVCAAGSTCTFSNQYYSQCL